MISKDIVGVSHIEYPKQYPVKTPDKKPQLGKINKQVP